MPKLLARTVFDLYLRITWNPKPLGQIVVTLLREWSHSNDTECSWRKNNHFNLLFALRFSINVVKERLKRSF